MELMMTASRLAAKFAVRVISRPLFSSMILLAVGIFVAPTQAAAQQPQSTPDGRVIVIGESSVSVPPDYARIMSGVTTRAETLKEAIDTNSKLMDAIIAALLNSGIAQKDVQTSQFSAQPVFAPQEPRAEPKLSGFSVSNQVIVILRQIGRVGEILDHMVTAGATDIGNIAFLLSDPSKALDRAREAAVSDARRKAELYARASGIGLGRITWITEDLRYAPPNLTEALLAPAARTASVPIVGGDDTLQVRITVGFEIVR